MKLTKLWQDKKIKNYYFFIYTKTATIPIVLTMFDIHKQKITDAIKRTDNIIAVKKITDPDMAENARKIAGEIKTFLGELDNEHKTIKAPVLEKTKEIDGARRAIRVIADPIYNKLVEMVSAYDNRLAKKDEEIRDGMQETTEVSLDWDKMDLSQLVRLGVLGTTTLGAIEGNIKTHCSQNSYSNTELLKGVVVKKRLKTKIKKA